MTAEAADEDGNRPLIGLRGRILAISLLPMLLAALILAAYFSHQRIDSLETALTGRGVALARHLAEAAGYDLYAGQPVYLKRLLDYERDMHGAAAIGIAGSDRQWWLVSGQVATLGEPALQPAPLRQRRGEWIYFSHPILLDNTLSASAESFGDSETLHIGQVYVAFSRTGIDLARSEIITATLTVLALLLAASGLLAWRMSTRLSRPLNDAIEAVKALAGGALHTRVEERSQGELRLLERGINSMASALDASTRDLEQRIREATASLQEQKQAADAATLAKSRFLAAASHDLRQPLHALKLLVSALRESMCKDDAESQWLVGNIEQASDTMESLLGTLLDLSRLDAGVVVARPTCFHLDELFEKLDQQFKPLAAEKGLRLRIQPSRMAIFSDPLLLERVMANLISNAIRYTSRGGVLVGARRVQRDWVRLEVRDTGQGIPESYRSRIFEEYFQMDNTARDRDKGLGLGLSIVLRLVKLLGSDIDVSSTPGRGSCFSLRASRCDPPPYTGPPTEALVQVPMENTLVAFIDDDETILEAMLALFEQWGIELATGSDAISVREDLLRLGRQPDIIICDYRLREGRTGLEAIAELHAAFGADIPAILITGDTSPGTIQAIDGTGYSVLYKPLQPARLRSLLSHLLAKNRDRRQGR